MTESLTAVQLLEANTSLFIGGLPPTLPEQLIETEQRLGVSLPEEYQQFLLTWDGGYFENVRLKLYEWIELEDFNPEPDWSEKLPEMLLFGSDEGAYVFYFDPKNRLGKGTWAIYSFSMGAVCFEDSSYVAKNFTHLIQRALNGEYLTDGSMLKDDPDFVSD
jgi:SMI1 / KNR4 family (SUKH-1)